MHLDRYRVIAETLARHGLGALLARTGIEPHLPFGHDASRPDAHPHLSSAAHLRLALEELGPTFVKLGQLLSTRSELLPPAYIAELARLQDSLTPIPADVIRSAVEQELEWTDRAHLCARSTTRRWPRPRSDRRTPPRCWTARKWSSRSGDRARSSRSTVDLEILHNLAARADRYWEEAADYDLVGLADEFARTLRAELNYLTEARNAEAVRRELRRQSRHRDPDGFLVQHAPRGC